LLFRNFPPYFLRALGAEQDASETQVAALTAAVDVVEMGRDTTDL
jgi:hypothetical protein